MNIQQLLDNSTGAFITLPPGEYKGNFVIKRPCRVIGNHTTIWAEKGTVLTIDSAITTIENLRIETLQNTAIVSHYQDTVFQNVEVSGRVEGVAEQKGNWNFPKMLCLGEIPQNTECKLYFDVEVPHDCEVISLLQGMRISPETLSAGRHTMTLYIEKLPQNTCLYGDILFVTECFARRSYISGIVTGQTENNIYEKVLFSQTKEIKQTQEVRKINSACKMSPPITWDKHAFLLQKGQRTALNDLQQQPISIIMEMESNIDIDIDPYVFLLQKDGKAKKEQDMVFFGNESAENNCVIIEGKKVMLHLTKVASDIERISIAYGIYESKFCFGDIKKFVVKLEKQGKEEMVFLLEDLAKETVMIAFDFYRYKGNWKINAIGAGYHKGLKKLCESYGLEVQ